MGLQWFKISEKKNDAWFFNFLFEGFLVETAPIWEHKRVWQFGHLCKSCGFWGLQNPPCILSVEILDVDYREREREGNVPSFWHGHVERSYFLFSFFLWLRWLDMKWLFSKQLISGHKGKGHGSWKRSWGRRKEKMKKEKEKRKPWFDGSLSFYLYLWISALCDSLLFFSPYLIWCF